MTEGKGFRLPGVRTSVLVGLGLRLAVVAAALRDPSIPVKNDDYLAMGRVLLETGRHSDPVFPPLYPALCAAATFLFGAHAVAAVLVFQALCGSAAILLAARIAARFGGNASRFAALFVALDPVLVVATGFVLTEDLYTALLLAAILLALEARAATLLPIGAGLALGLAILTRSVGLVAVPPILGLAALGKPDRIRRVLLVTLGVALTVLPWCARNAVVSGHFAPSSSSSWNFAALVVGPAKAAADGVPAEASLSVWERGEAPPADPWERGERARRAALGWAVEHPGAVARAVAAGQARLILGPGRANLSELLLRPAPRPLLGLFLAERLLLLGFAAFGTVRLFRSSPAFLATLFSLALLHALPAGAAGYSRFLRPVVPLLAILGSGIAAPRALDSAPREKA